MNHLSKMAAVRHFDFSETALPMAGAAGGGCAVPQAQCKTAMSALTTPVSSGGMGRGSINTDTPTCLP